MGGRELEHATRVQERVLGPGELRAQQRHQLESDRQLVGPGQVG